jgi:WD repeat-containing protein 26
MRLSSDDVDSSPSVSTDNLPEAGPSTPTLSNGHNGFMKGNGFITPFANGNGKAAAVADVRRAEKQPHGVAKVSLPGTTLYDDSYVDREEFVRLVIQSLRDVGYM